MSKKKTSSNKKNLKSVETKPKQTVSKIEESTEIVEKPKTAVEKEKKSPKSVENSELKTDTTSISIINQKELNDLIEEDLGIKKESSLKPKKHFLVHTFLILLLIISLFSFGVSIFDKNTPVSSLINSLLLTVFTILFVVVSITYNRNKKGLIFLGSLLLIGYFILGLNSHFDIVSSPISTTPDFSGKSITEVIKWANKNNITVNQEYEYSDMISEYSVISQDIEAGTNLNEVESITISISEGPNPSKEIMVPSMIGWDSERVIRFVLDNYLSNVNVEFVESDKAQDTVIEQSASGSFKRDDELHLTFSYGEELSFSEVTLIDFTNQSKFEVEFYMRQHQLEYEFAEDFDAKIKRGYAMKQSIEAGDAVSVHADVVTVTISKGPEIKVPDLTKYDMTKVTEWAIENKVKINFSDSYDDTVKENAIIRANYSEGDIIEQGTVVKIVISRGSLKMPKFQSLSDFREWADKYEIAYEEEHEFSDTIEAGEVIRYSYKTGDTIKNNDTIVVKISDGSKKTVPSLIGLTKNEAISKLEKAGFKYNFIYKNSTEKKDKVLSQSISSGSEVSSGTTISFTLSNGKAEATSNSPKNSNVEANTSNDNHNSNTNTSGNNNTTSDNTPVKDCSCNIRASQLQLELLRYDNCSAAASGLKSYVESKCPNVTISVTCVTADDSYNPGDYFSGYMGGETNSCSLSTKLAK